MRTTRNLDHALTTTHSEVRVFVIMARYCSRAVWEDARKHAGWSLELVGHWLAYIAVNKGLRVVEWYARIYFLHVIFSANDGWVIGGWTQRRAW
jgi:hypothetical protein